jgi:hypothetical protein
MSKAVARIVISLVVLLLAAGLQPGVFAQTPLAPGSIQVSRIQYDGNTVGDTFPNVFNDPNVTGLQGSIWIDQFSSVPATPVAGSLSLPATGSNGTITSSFSSKSEGALMLSPNGSFLSYMGYQAADEQTNVSNSFTNYCPSQLNPPGAGPFFNREVAIINGGGLLTLTPEENAYSGDNPRAAITTDGTLAYMAGNSDSTTYTASTKSPICGQTSGTFGPGLTIGARLDSALGSGPDLSNQLGVYFAADRPDESAKQHIKDNNFRGIGIYPDANGVLNLYVAKGSGGNGDDGVFWVQNGTGAGLPTGTTNTIVELLGAPATDPVSKAVSPYTPFGFWFANPTTLYVADEGYANLNPDGSCCIPDPLAGLQKWARVNGTWQLQYVIQNGLNLYQPQLISGYPIPTSTYGIRNMTGWNNGDGTVTIFAISAQYSSISGGEPDPTNLVGITDSLAATALPANEQFVTIQTSATQQVFRGVAFIPPAPGTTRQTQTINFQSVGSVTYGSAPITLQSTATSGWPITYTVTSGPATVAGNVLTITGAGSVTVEADQSGNTDFAPATTTQTFTVAKATPNITWPAPSPISYGTPLSGTQLNATADIAGSFVYTPSAGTILSAGNQTLSTTFTPTDTTNYSSATVTVPLLVTQATPTITWETPAPITYGTALSGTQLNASASVPGILVYTPAAGTVLGAGNQTLSVTFTPTDATDYTTATDSVPLSVNQATPTINWPTPSPITYGTPLSATQLNAVASVPGTYVYNPAAGTVLNAGNQLLSVTFTPTDSTDYKQATGSVNLQVNQASQTISFTTHAPAQWVYGQFFTVAAVSTSGLPITYTSSGACTNNGPVYTMTSGTGTCNVTANQPGNQNYLAASPVTEHTTAQRANPNVTFTGAPATAPYGTSFVLNATTNSSAVAYITNNNTASCSLSGPYAPVTVTILKGTGTCVFTATWGADQNYNPATAFQQTIAVKAVPVLTWATPAPISYGTALGDTQLDASANVPGTFAYAPAAGKILTVGANTLSVTFKPTDTANYTTNSAQVQLQVLKATTTTTITSSSTTVNLNAHGTATVALSYNVTSYKPTGSVTLAASTGEVCSAAVSPSGNGSCKLTFTTTGTRTILATYGGDSNHTGSNNSGQTPAVKVTVLAH